MMGFLSSSYDGKKSRFTEWACELPEPGPLKYLFDWTMQAGIKSLTWCELKAWSDLSGIVPTPAEAQTMIEISHRWTTEIIKGADKDALPPWMPEFD